MESYEHGESHECNSIENLVNTSVPLREYKQTKSETER